MLTLHGQSHSQMWLNYHKVAMAKLKELDKMVFWDIHRWYFGTQLLFKDLNFSWFQEDKYI